jgi:dTDP-4-amino-4,6-dideoxygalactose transaminase
MVSCMTIPYVNLEAELCSIREEIQAAIDRVLNHTAFILGPEVSLFEEDFAAYCGARYAVGVDSGVSALELGMRALGIGPGDEVITPAHSFIASSSAISFTGARPVLVDVDPVTYNIDPYEVRRSITPRTRAVMPVHLYGQPADMDAILEVAEAYGLWVIEDACQAHGARYKGRRVGSLGHIAAFSFYPAKNLGAYGDAGAVVTNDAKVADTVRMMRNYGQSEKYQHGFLGCNHRLDTLQAAVLLVKLRYLDHWNARRAELAQLYTRLLANSEVTTPKVAPGCDHVYHLYVIQSEDRDGLQAFLRKRGIDTGIHYPIPIHLQRAYTSLGYRPGAFPVTESSATRLLSLPMFPELKETELQYVVDSTKSFIPQKRGGR